ncbi:MAG TPA: diguanylate cyclase [Candidatus Treponema faecavium]|nr:diguanylate cyclase [Candidatus Treponema faecavium]
MAFVVRSVLDSFLRSIFEERNIEKAADYAADGILLQGIDIFEHATGKAALVSNGLHTVMDPNVPLAYEIQQYQEFLHTDDACSIFCILLLTFMRDNMAGKSVFCRMSAAAAKVDSRWLITSLHASVPAESDEEDDFFPVNYASEVGCRISHEMEMDIMQMLSQMIPGGIIGRLPGSDLPIFMINDELLGYLGYTYKEYISATNGLSIKSIYPADREKVSRLVLDNLRMSSEYSAQYRMLKKNGSVFWVFDKGKKILTENGRCSIISVIIDISETVLFQKTLELEASHDVLTPVLNRKAAVRMIESSFMIYTKGVFFILDIDNFKRLNDTKGHQAGDDILREFAHLLLSCSRNTDIVARIGGDEFIAYYPGMGSAAAAEEKAIQIQALFTKLIAGKYPDAGLSVSIGAVIRSDELKFSQLYRHADEALYQVKRAGKGSYAFFAKDSETA